MARFNLSNLGRMDLPQPAITDPLSGWRSGLETLGKAGKEAEENRKRRNLEKAQQFLIGKMKDPDFAKNIGNNLGLVLDATPESGRPAVINNELNRRAAAEKQRADLAAKTQRMASKPPMTPQAINKAITQGTPEEVAAALEYVEYTGGKVLPEAVKSKFLIAAEERKLTSNAPVTIEQQDGFDVVTGLTKNKRVYRTPAAPRPVNEPGSWVETVGPDGRPKKGWISNKDAAGMGMIDVYQKSGKEKDDNSGYVKPTTEEMMYMKDFGDSFKSDKFVKESIEQAFATQQIDSYEQTDLELQADPNIPAESKEKMLRVLKNTAGIGHLFSFMHRLDKTAVKAPELAMIKAGALAAGLGENQWESGLASLKKWWKNKEFALSPDAEAVLTAISNNRKRLAYKGALNNVILKTNHAIETLGPDRAKSLLLANLGDSEIAGEAYEAGYQMFMDKSLKRSMPQPTPVKPTYGPPNVLDEPTLGGNLGGMPINPGPADGGTASTGRSITIPELTDIFRKVNRGGR